MANESIFHIVDAATWVAAVARGVYRPASFAAEGFIHFSSRSQIVPVANRRFAGVDGLLLIELPTAAQRAYRIVWEDSYGEGQTYPHVYSELQTADVISALEFRPNEDGSFTLPSPATSV